jgi:hypothetical protein
MDADTNNLPAEANWPAKWPESIFGWVLQLVYDANEKIVINQTLGFSQMLIYDDYGQTPTGTNLP